MTTGDLIDAVSYLGFETRLEEEAQRQGFYSALTRALSEISALRPKEKRIDLYHRRVGVVLHIAKGFLRCGGEDVQIVLPKGSRAFAALVSGSGRLILRGRSGERQMDFATAGAVQKLSDYAEEGDVLLFRDGASGAFDYRVVSLAVYGGVSGDSAEDIPAPGEPARYRIGAMTSDFAAFLPPCLLCDGREYTGEYAVEGSDLLLPADAPEGVYTVRYTPSTPVFTEDDGRDREIPLDADLLRLLPLLLASELWLDDSPDKASYYSVAYQREAARLRASLRRPTVFRQVCSVNGW